MFDTRTPDGKVVLYARGSGEVFVRFPVDAREMLASGAYTLSLAEVTEAVTEAVTDLFPAPPAETPSAMSPVGVPIVVGTAEIAAPMREPVRSDARAGKGRRR